VSVFEREVQVSVRQGSTRPLLADPLGSPAGGGRQPAARVPDAPVAERFLPGQQADVAGGRVLRIWHPDVANSVRLQSRQLVFNAAPLGEVASEFNRYNETQLHVEGPIRDRQVSGVFSTDHPQSLVLFLQRDPSLLVSRKDSGCVFLHVQCRKGGPPKPTGRASRRSPAFIRSSIGEPQVLQHQLTQGADQPLAPQNASGS
jgi:hypothetical protein